MSATSHTHTHTFYRSFVDVVGWLMFLIHSSRPLCTTEMNRFKMQNILMCDRRGDEESWMNATERTEEEEKFHSVLFCFIAVKTNVIISTSILLDTSIKQRQLNKLGPNRKQPNKQSNCIFCMDRRRNTSEKLWTNLTNGICINKSNRTIITHATKHCVRLTKQ